MSVRDSTILNPAELRYLLLDSLRSYSEDVIFLDGQNPYRIAINKREIYVYIKNVHESGANRSNPDECRIQISRTVQFDRVLSGHRLVLVLGYFQDERVFTAWNPFLWQSRFNEKRTVSDYSRFSAQERASNEGIALYRKDNDQTVISFRPEYLGLYIDNVEKIHSLSEGELLKLVGESDSLGGAEKDGVVELGGESLVVTHARRSRDPAFRKRVYEAYQYRCAFCGIQLQLIEAAHIVPHSHAKGTDEVNNGLCLCALHHSAYDNAVLYFDDANVIKVNNAKLNYLVKIQRDGGLHTLQQMTQPTLQLPVNPVAHPLIENIRLANSIRGIEGYEQFSGNTMS